MCEVVFEGAHRLRRGRTVSSEGRNGCVAGGRLGPALAMALVALVLPTGGGVAAQERLQAVERLRAVIDSVRPLYREATAEADQLRDAWYAEHAEPLDVTLDTVRVGPFRVVLRPGQEDDARVLIRGVWRQFRPYVSDDTTDLSGPLLLYEPDAESGRWPEFDGTTFRVGAGGWTTPFRLRQTARNAVGGTLTRQLPDGLRRWTSDLPMDLDPDWNGIHRSLVTTPSLAARRCFREGGEWCWDALGVGRTDPEWAHLYAPEERLRMAGEYEPLYGTDQRRLQRRCLREDVQEACDRYLRQRLSGPPIPLDADVRASVVSLALAEGGEGAYARLRAAGGSLPARLARAAGTSPEELIETWRSRVLEADPGVRDDLGRTAGATLAWILIFGAFATRSTRWRFD